MKRLLKSIFTPSWRKGAYLIFCIISILITPGVARIEVTTDAAGALLKREGEATDNYQWYLREFKADYGGVVLASIDYLPVLPEMVEDLEDLDMVDKVDALFNSPYVIGTVDEVQVADFNDWMKGQDLDVALNTASAYKPYQGKIISDDQKYLAIYIRAKKDEDLPEGTSIDAVVFTSAIQKVMDKYNTDGEKLLAGEMYYSAAMSEATASGTTLIGLVVLVMIVVVGLMTRSILIGVLAGANGGIATLFCFGLMGYLGIEQNPLNAQSVNALIPLGAALTLLANRYVQFDPEWIFGIWPKSAVKSFVLGVSTTALGFGMTADSSYVVIRELGWLGAFGIMMCLFTTVFLIFPLLTWRRTPQQHEINFDISVSMKRRRYLPLIIVLAIVTILGLSAVEVNYDSSEFLADDHPARIATDKVADVFGSRYAMALVISDVDALDPVVWNQAAEFYETLAADFKGIEVVTLADSVSIFIQAFTADDEKPLQFPTSRDMMAQSLLFFDSNDIESSINFDETAITIMLQTPFSSSEEYRQLRAQVAQFADDTGFNAFLTGRAALYYEASDNIAMENLESLWKALGIVFVLFLGFFRSFRVATIAIIANIFPVFGCLALYGLLGTPLDTSTSLTMVIAFGIIVDDTIHLVLRFLHNVREKSMSPSLAASLTVLELRSPILQTTIAITFGFLVFMSAELLVFHSFGKMMILVLVYACVVWDLTFLPWMLERWAFSPRKVKALLVNASS